MLVNFLSKKKSISYAGCMTQVYFFLAFANTESHLLTAMATDHHVAICDPFCYVPTESSLICPATGFLLLHLSPPFPLTSSPEKSASLL